MTFDKIIPILNVLNRFAARSTEIRDIHELAMEVERIIEDVIEAEYTGLYLYDFIDKKLKLYFAKGFTEEERLEAERTVMDRHPGYVFRTGKTFYVPDVESNNPPISISSKRSFRIRTRLSIPVFNNDQVVGVFSIASPEKNKFTEEQIAVFSFIGNIAGSVYGHILNRNELQKLALIARHTDNAVLITDKEGRTDWVNDAFEETTGYSIEDVSGQMIIETLIGSSSQKKSRDKILQAMMDKKSIETNVELVTKEGKAYWAWLEIQPVFNEDGELIQFISIHRDISEQKKIQDALKSSTSRLSTLIRNLHTGILVEDENSKVVLVNTEFCNLFNISADPEELVGMDCIRILNEAKQLFKDPEGVVKRIFEVLPPRLPAFDENVEMADGAIYERDYLPIFSKDKFMGNLWRYSNITPRKKAERDLEKARQEAISANIAKSQFLANMSHEIRTPLNAIYGLSRLLEDTQVSEEQQKLISGLNSSSEGLLGIVNDILDFTKIEAGQMELVETEFSLNEVVKKVFDAFEYKAAEKEIKLHIKFDKGIRYHLFGDYVRLRQVLINLMNNAIKFTQKGNVTLECRLIGCEEEACTIYFNVSDTGIGIAEENLTKIFQSFQQEDTGTTRSYGGTGLGLAISKQLVELMGGSLEVTSEKNKGSEFFFTVQFKKAVEEVKPDVVESAELNVKSLEGVRVLLVEDNQFNQFIAKSMLEKWSMVVTVANNGIEAIERLKEGAFGIVLMDLQMPEMGGLEAARKIRSEMQMDVPIIALTANAIKGVIEECLAAGMNDYIPKPFNPDLLATKIKSLVD